MTMTLNFAPAVEQELREMADRQGKTVEGLAAGKP